MPLPSPFHARTADLCTSLNWKTKSGTFSAADYCGNHEREYFAIRQTVAMIDASPLYKMDVRGPAAASFLARTTSRDITQLEVSHCAQSCWCDEQGKVLGEGLVSRIDEHHFRLTSAGSNFNWFLDQASQFDVELEDTSATIATLAVHGPCARDAVTAAVIPAAQVQISALPNFRVMLARIREFDCLIVRSDSTGDFGFELSVPVEFAVDLWDAIADSGFAYSILAVGIDALDIAKVEAGQLTLGVDYESSRDALIPAHQHSPFELNLGSRVDLERAEFLGQTALLAERNSGTPKATIGLVLNMNEIERLHDFAGLPLSLPTKTWNARVPIFDSQGLQVGRASSGVWSPTLQQNLAIGIVDETMAEFGSDLQMDVLVDGERHRVNATVSQLPFYDPPRNHSIPTDGVSI